MKIGFGLDRKFWIFNTFLWNQMWWKGRVVISRVFVSRIFCCFFNLFRCVLAIVLPVSWKLWYFHINFIFIISSFSFDFISLYQIYQISESFMKTVGVGTFLLFSRKFPTNCRSGYSHQLCGSCNQTSLHFIYT